MEGHRAWRRERTHDTRKRLVSGIRLFWLCSVAAWIAVVVAARIRRGSFFARFAAVLVGLHTLISCALASHVGPLLGAFAYLQAAVYLHYFSLARPRMRPLAYRVFVSIPASFFAAATLLAFPWA